MNRPPEQLLAYPAGPIFGGDAHAFNERAPAALIRDVRNERQLQYPDDAALIDLDDDELVVRIALNGGEGVGVALG